MKRDWMIAGLSALAVLGVLAAYGTYQTITGPAAETRRGTMELQQKMQRVHELERKNRIDNYL